MTVNALIKAWASGFTGLGAAAVVRRNAPSGRIVTFPSPNKRQKFDEISITM